MTRNIQSQSPTEQEGLRPSLHKVSYEEFLQSDEHMWAEWVDGEVMPLSPASVKHQLLVNFLAASLQHFVEANRLGLVISAPFQMKLEGDLPGREPDILFIAQDHLDKLQNTYLAGAADIVVEVISPESLVRDRGTKLLRVRDGWR
ncbi:MAG: Uma2 family endonuclease [Pyrinomonadaceae bacterium]